MEFTVMGDRRLLFAGKKFRNARPVDYVPDGPEVIRPAVLIFQVVGMFPYVHAEDRRAAGGAGWREHGIWHDGIVLICRGGDGQLAVFDDQPGPAGAEALGAGVLEFGFEIGE